MVRPANPTDGLSDDPQNVEDGGTRATLWSTAKGPGKALAFRTSPGGAEIILRHNCFITLVALVGMHMQR